MHTIFFDSPFDEKYSISNKSNIKYVNQITSIHFEWTINDIQINEINSHSYQTPILFRNFIYYPKVSLLMLSLFLISMILLILYISFDFKIIHPLALVWGLIAFGGMYGVLVSAASEIDAARNKRI